MNIIMDLIDRLKARITETKNFTIVLKRELASLFQLLYSNNQKVDLSIWTGNCRLLINSVNEIQNLILDKCLTPESIQSEEALDKIQEAVLNTGLVWLAIRHLLMLSNQNFNEPDHLMLKDEVESLIESLVRRTSIVTLQPPQVIKTNSRFPVIVRFLAGALFNLSLPTKVQIMILNEEQTQTALNDKIASSCSGALLPRETFMEKTPTDRYFARFESLVVKKVTRCDKRSLITVMDEKFVLTFQTQVTLTAAKSKLTYLLQIFSLPLVVTVHINQETNAWATIAWDNAFAGPSRVPFEVPDQVSWPEAARMLSHKFHELTGCHLTQSDLLFMARKLLRDMSLNNFECHYVKWVQLAKVLLPDVPFTFWEWFYSIALLIKDHLNNLWNADRRLIKGFISRQESENELHGKPDGTFLLRFSETSLGSVSINCIQTNTLNERVVIHLMPFGAKDFTIRSLADRINDISELRYLFPNTPKDEAFGPFYGPNELSKPGRKGYTKALLMTHIPQILMRGRRSSGSSQSFLTPPSSTPSPTNDQSQSLIELTNCPSTNSSFQSIENHRNLNDLDGLIQDVLDNDNDLFSSNEFETFAKLFY